MLHYLFLHDKTRQALVQTFPTVKELADLPGFLILLRQKNRCQIMICAILLLKIYGFDDTSKNIPGALLTVLQARINMNS